MYEETVGVPMILVGDGVPVGQVVETPVSHVDCFPTITDCVGLDRLDEDDCLRGRSLFDIAGGADPERTAFSEFHAAGSRTGVFMLRQADYKYVHYVDVDYPDTLFDLSSDPDESQNLAEESAYREVRTTFEQHLAQLCDPMFVNDQARGDQLARIAAAGGREAVLNGGSFGYTPAPGETPVYS
jgi:choline-sulfatase